MSVSRILIAINYFIGFLCGLSFIRSQSEFLHHYESKYLVIILLVPVLIWFCILQFVQNQDWKNRFIRVFIPWFTIIGFATCASIPQVNKHYYWVIFWVLIAGVMLESLRWGLYEMAERYISPAQIGATASYQGIFTELGIISASIFLKVYPEVSLNQISLMSWALIVATLLCLFYFLNPRRVELYFIQRKKTQSFHFEPEYSKIIWFFVIFGVTQGLFRMTQDSYVQTIFKLNALTAIDIQKNISSVFLLGSIFQLSTLFLNAKFFEAKRLSPTYIVMVSYTVQILVFIYTVMTGSIFSAILFLAISKPHTGIYFVSLNRIASFFKYSAGIAVKSFNRLGTVIVGGIIFALIPSSLHSQKILIPLFCVLSILIAYRLKSILLPIFEKNILSEHPDECVRSAIGLSYLQPPNYVEKMSQLLGENPAHVLKKQIILGLGFSKGQKSFEILENQFRSDKEEIQITVLEALKIARSNKATRFILDLVLSHRKSLTLRVRLNAAQMLAALYGTKSIPILMLGLKTEDPRQLANVLEALSQFQDSELSEIYKTYAQSSTPRVRANALLGLYGSQQEKSWVKKEIHKILSSSEPNDVSFQISIFYIIGKKKISEFTPILKKLLENHLMAQQDFKNADVIFLSYAQTLSWALLRLKVPIGAHVLLELLKSHIQSSQVKSPLHFILQLELNERLDLLEQWIALSQRQSETREVLVNYFEKSGYDLREEIEYLKSMNLLT